MANSPVKMKPSAATPQISSPPLAPEHQLTSVEKARIINNDPKIYGSFAEIGAGIDVARWFFKAGRASATIAKTMSAYDMVFSDAIYGAEKNHRYVCESRLLKMLEKEFSLLQIRLENVRADRSTFFAFADTMASKSVREGGDGGHGWMGVRFQTHPMGPSNDVILHLRLLDTSAIDQQEAVGIVGVNLIYSCFYHHDNPVTIVDTLCDALRQSRIEVDMIRFSGPAFKDVDHRLMSLRLVQNQLTDAVLISPEGTTLQPSEVFFNKHLLVQRARFRPLTKLHVEMLESAKKQFLKDCSETEANLIPVMEITLEDLERAATDAGGTRDTHEMLRDYLARVQVLCAQGYHVLISNYSKYFQLSEFFQKYSAGKVGLVISAANLPRIFQQRTYADVPGGILSALGQLFRENVRAYVFPALLTSANTSSSAAQEAPTSGTEENTGVIDLNLLTQAQKSQSQNAEKFISAKNFTPPAELVNLYAHMLQSHAIEDIKEFDTQVLSLRSDEVLEKLKRNDPTWKDAVPAKAAQCIVEKRLFAKGN